MSQNSDVWHWRQDITRTLLTHPCPQLNPMKLYYKVKVTRRNGNNGICTYLWVHNMCVCVCVCVNLFLFFCGQKNSNLDFLQLIWIFGVAIQIGIIIPRKEEENIYIYISYCGDLLGWAFQWSKYWRVLQIYTCVPKLFDMLECHTHLVVVMILWMCFEGWHSE